jgi:hypothetical protein
VPYTVGRSRPASAVRSRPARHTEPFSADRLDTQKIFLPKPLIQFSLFPYFIYRKNLFACDVFQLFRNSEMSDSKATTTTKAPAGFLPTDKKNEFVLNPKLKIVDREASWAKMETTNPELAAKMRDWDKRRTEMAASQRRQEQMARNADSATGLPIYPDTRGSTASPRSLY